MADGPAPWRLSVRAAAVAAVLERVSLVDRAAIEPALLPTIRQELRRAHRREQRDAAFMALGQNGGYSAISGRELAKLMRREMQRPSSAPSERRPLIARA